MLNQSQPNLSLLDSEEDQTDQKNNQPETCSTEIDQTNSANRHLITQIANNSQQMIQNFSLQGCRARGENLLKKATSNPVLFNPTDAQIVLQNSTCNQQKNEKQLLGKSKEADCSNDNRLYSMIAKFEQKIMKTEKIK